MLDTDVWRSRILVERHPNSLWRSLDPIVWGAAIKVRSEPTRNVVGMHGASPYYLVERPLLDGRPQLEIRVATPEDGPSRALDLVPAARVLSWQIANPSLSPKGEWLALPLTDGFTTNIWALSTRTGVWRQVTDFGDRATFIARRVSWSPDGQSILAAVGAGDADIVLLEGLLARRYGPFRADHAPTSGRVRRRTRHLRPAG